MTPPSSTTPASPWRFFSLALGLTWMLDLPALLAKHGRLAGGVEPYLGLVGLGAFGPMIAAVVLARREPGGARALFRLRGTTPLPIALALAAPFVSGAILTLGLAVFGALGGDVSRWFFLPLEPERLVALVVFSVGEEVGWRGFALPRLLERISPLAASVVVGLSWAAWHLGMFVLEAMPADVYLLSIPYFVAGSVVFTAFHATSGGSLGVAILLHMGAHLDNSHRALPGSVAPFAVHTIGFVVVALAVVARDVHRWTATPLAGGSRPPQPSPRP